ncbi:MAG: hypothetical protein NZ822_00500 [Patescibacteria group bacterium]|nr:hypothetical protein [Patescibacteria group bacterium]
MIFLKILILDDLIEFIDFWFHHFPQKTIRSFFDFVYLTDRYLNFRPNLRNITKPLFGDFSLVGYAIALPYRLIKLILGFIFYLAVALLYLLFLGLWLLLPIFLLFYGILL